MAFFICCHLLVGRKLTLNNYTGAKLKGFISGPKIKATSGFLPACCILLSPLSWGKISKGPSKHLCSILHSLVLYANTSIGCFRFSPDTLPCIPIEVTVLWAWLFAPTRRIKGFGAELSLRTSFEVLRMGGYPLSPTKGWGLGLDLKQNVEVP